MSHFTKGAAAGFAGAAAIAALLQLNIESGFLPELDFVALLGSAIGVGRTGGWVLHVLIGGLWGALFAWLDPDLPGDNLRQRGIVFACGAWLLMMLFLMPLAGAGLFGLASGILLPLASLVLHVIFGAVMGSAYGWLTVQSLPLRFRQTRRT